MRPWPIIRLCLILGFFGTSLLLIWFLAPRVIQSFSISACHNFQEIIKTVRFVVDAMGALLAVLGLFYENSKKADDPEARKTLTRVGLVFLSIFIAISAGNLAISRFSDLVTQKLADDAAQNFDVHLKAALKEKNEELVKQLEPTIEAQKQMISKEMGGLRSNIDVVDSNLEDDIRGTTNRIEDNFAKSENRAIKTFVQGEADVRDASIPLRAFTVLLSAPEAKTQLGGGSPNELKIDKGYLDRFREARDKECRNAPLDITPTGLSIQGTPLCKEMVSQLFSFVRTRPLEHFLDPPGHLNVDIDINLAAHDLILWSSDCTFGNSSYHYRCLDRRMMAYTSNLAAQIEMPALSAYGLADSYMPWYTNETTDQSFKSPGVNMGDTYSPRLSIGVCDSNASNETAATVIAHLATFPSRSALEIVVHSSPDKNKGTSLRSTSDDIVRVYQFHSVSVTPRDACIHVAYESD